MIDTDKYEGHTPAPWKWGDEAWSKNGLINGEESLGVMKPHNPSKADAQLIADAPLLLAEVKRLRGRHVAFMQWMLENYDEIVNEWEASDITEASE